MGQTSLHLGSLDWHYFDPSQDNDKNRDGEESEESGAQIFLAVTVDSNQETEGGSQQVAGTSKELGGRLGRKKENCFGRCDG